jgi:hypothetical protein
MNLSFICIVANKTISKSKSNSCAFREERTHKKKIEYAFAKSIMVLQSFSQQKN